MKFNTISVFPETFQALNGYGVLGKALENKVLEVNSINLRDFSNNKHNKVDDEIYGGGPGMLIKPEPLYDAIQSLDTKGPVIYMSPQGKVLDNDLAISLSKEEEITIVCGHYEGIDQRIIENYINLEVTIGDYIVTGGEIPAMILIDCVSRFIPGVVGNNESVIEDTFFNGLLKYPCYTRPQNFNGHEVPEVLLSGNHAKINEWRKEKSVEITKIKRPDLLND